MNCGTPGSSSVPREAYWAIYTGIVWLPGVYLPICRVYIPTRVPLSHTHQGTTPIPTRVHLPYHPGIAQCTLSPPGYSTVYTLLTRVNTEGYPPPGLTLRDTYHPGISMVHIYHPGISTVHIYYPG